MRHFLTSSALDGAWPLTCSMFLSTSESTTPSRRASLNVVASLPILRHHSRAAGDSWSVGSPLVVSTSVYTSDQNVVLATSVPQNRRYLESYTHLHVKAKFHYAIWSQTDPNLVADRFRSWSQTCSELEFSLSSSSLAAN